MVLKVFHASTLILLFLCLSDQKQETHYVAEPYYLYKLCVQQKCEKLFCLISDNNCQREITKSEKCKESNLNCQGFFEWEMERSDDDTTPVPISLRLCFQLCPADRLESENFYEIEQCRYRCAFQEIQKGDL
ncbi:hypothetical protein ABPG72_007012 [Tetrahymena utriculariae]